MSFTKYRSHHSASSRSGSTSSHDDLAMLTSDRFFEPEYPPGDISHWRSALHSPSTFFSPCSSPHTIPLLISSNPFNYQITRISLQRTHILILCPHMYQDQAFKCLLKSSPAHCIHQPHTMVLNVSLTQLIPLYKAVASGSIHIHRFRYLPLLPWKKHLQPSAPERIRQRLAGESLVHAPDVNGLR